MIPPLVAPELTTLASLFVAQCQEKVPGLLARVFLTGSGVTPDWKEASSDVDLVFVVSHPLSAQDGAELKALHAATKGSNPVDGLYLTAHQLEAGPDDIQSAPQSIDGEFELAAAGGQLNWVTWLELETGIEAEVSGTELLQWKPSTIEFENTAQKAMDYCAVNLRTYWLELAEQAVSALSGREHDEPVSAEMVLWTTLGPPRLVSTLRTGKIISKSEAGRFAIESWPEHTTLIYRTIDARAGASQTFTVADALESIDLLRKAALST